MQPRSGVSVDQDFNFVLIAVENTDLVKTKKEVSFINKTSLTSSVLFDGSGLAFNCKSL